MPARRPERDDHHSRERPVRGDHHHGVRGLVEDGHLRRHLGADGRRRIAHRVPRDDIPRDRLPGRERQPISREQPGQPQQHHEDPPVQRGHRDGEGLHPWCGRHDPGSGGDCRVPDQRDRHQVVHLRGRGTAGPEQGSRGLVHDFMEPEHQHPHVMPECSHLVGTRRHQRSLPTQRQQHQRVLFHRPGGAEFDLHPCICGEGGRLRRLFRVRRQPDQGH